jgi:hypothetical protein
MAELIIDWDKATLKVSVLVHHTATSERQEIELPLSTFTERFARIEAAIAGAITAVELLIDGQTTMSPEEIVERLLYPEHFDQAEQMRGARAYERINIARTRTMLRIRGRDE